MTPSARLTCTLSLLILASHSSAWASSTAAPNPVPPRALRQYSFTAKDGRSVYQVRIGGDQCITPCTLNLLPGIHHVDVSGARRLERELKFPAVPAEISLGRGVNKGRVVGGSILLGLGLTAGVIGGLMAYDEITFLKGLFGSALMGQPASPPHFYFGNQMAEETLPWLLLPLGLTGIILGAKKLAHIHEDRMETRPRLLSATLAPLTRGTGVTAALAWSF